MMTSPPALDHTSRRAFSLVETTLTMGLVATVMLPLIAVMGSASLKQRKTEDRQMATRLAAEIFDALGRTPPGEPLRLPFPGTDDTLTERPLGVPSPGATFLVSYDARGRPVRTLPLSAAENGLSRPEEGEAYLVEIAFSSDNTGGPLTRARVTVESPVEAGRKHRQSDALTSYLSPQP